MISNLLLVSRFSLDAGSLTTMSTFFYLIQADSVTNCSGHKLLPPPKKLLTFSIKQEFTFQKMRELKKK